MKRFLLTVVFGLIVAAPALGEGVLFGDYDSSGEVGQSDMDIVLLNWGTGNFPGNEAAIPGGGPYDGTTGATELDGVLLNWGNASVAFSSITSIPEPGTMTLVALVAIGLATGRWRR